MTVNGIGSFAKEQTIEFATSSDARITVFHGENGAGKTSTLNAILWGLTGQVSPSLMRPSVDLQREVLFNQGVLEADGTPSVDIYFEHDGTEYRAIRRYESGSISGDFELWAKRGGTQDPFTKNSESVMGKILPAGLARYFIFDGEGFSKSAEHSESLFRNSVENILGFDFVKRALGRVEHVRKLKLSEAEKIASRRIADDRKRAQYEQAMAQIEISNGIINDRSKEVDFLREVLEDIRSQIASLNIDRVNDLQNQARSLRNDVHSLKSAVRDFQYQRLMLINHFYRPIFGGNLIRETLGVIEEHRQKKVIPGPFNKQFIEDLIASGVCICGDCLNESKIAALKSQLEKGYTSSLQQRLTRAQAVTADDLSKVEEFKKRYQELTIGISDHRVSIESKEEQLRVVELELDDLSDRDAILSDLRNQERRHQASLNKAEDEIAQARSNKEAALQMKQKSSAVGVATTKHEDFLRAQVSKLDAVLDYGRSFLEKEMEWCHRFVREEMQSFISRTNIPYSVHLDSGFRFQFRSQTGKSINGSTGEQKTLEFAFLCSLVKLVRVKSNDDNGLLIPAGSLPLVIDAPFSDVAERYVKYISDMLLSVSEQLAILTINKDWPALEQATIGKVGKEYLLIKNIIQDSEERTEERHSFRGREYVCVNYRAAMNHTTVQEIADG